MLHLLSDIESNNNHDIVNVHMCVNNHFLCDSEGVYIIQDTIKVHVYLTLS